MDYENTEIKLDSLIGYFNERKINLSPIFQRGRAWSLNMRQELIKNIVRHRPIPAIFLYKEESDAKYSYSILDGKQRLESILLFIGDKNPKLKIDTWKEYIFDRQYRRQQGFKAKFQSKMIPFSAFPDDAIRDLREYQLPMIEIKLDEETNLDEIINLFVDINQKGAKVTRINIVRALKRDDAFLKSVYELVAEKQPRYQDIFVKVKKGSVPLVLGKLSIVAGGADKTARADRMWGKLMELALFIRNNKTHGKGSDVLKKFISKSPEPELTIDEKMQLRRVFTFLEYGYRTELVRTRLASDYSHFYILATALLAGNLLPKNADQQLRETLITKLTTFGKMLEIKSAPRAEGEETDMERYINLSSRQTTDSKKRKQRQDLFEKIINTL
jgi:Protein of unknown function DUF262